MGNTRGVNIGEFEELVLLVVGMLHDNAYGVEVRNTVIQETGRKVNISAVHEVLKRLEKKGLLRTEVGKAALDHSRELRNNLYGRIPEVKFNFSY